jgi:hypothetical protein
MKPQNFEERLIWYSIIWTYGSYLLGILLPINSLLAWVLFFYLCKKIWYQQEDTPVEKRIRIPWVLWIWVISMPVMMITKIMAFDDLGMEKNDYIRGLIGWTMSWALLALFPLIGCLNIRPQLIYRAVCILCLQSLIFLPICYFAYLVHLPDPLYSSPLERIFQNGELFYTISLYTYTNYNHELRFTLFTPWPPALGIIGNLYFLLALQETDKKWRWLGIVAGIVMSVVSTSRLASMALPGVSLAVWILTNFWRPTVQIWAGFICFVSGIFSSVILRVATDFKDAILDARSESTVVRKRLIDIAFERSKEAPIWGHGNQAPSPKIVEHMPIGSHTTWGGVMFVHGTVGFITLLVPVLCTLFALIIKAQKSRIAKVGLGAFLVLLFFSSGENIDSLVYICWPAWVIIGMALKNEVQSPFYVRDKREASSGLMLEQQ